MVSHSRLDSDDTGSQTFFHHSFFLLRPGGCPVVNDDVFHFVGISLGPDAGEQIIQDGLEANCSPSGGWNPGWFSECVLVDLYGPNNNELRPLRSDIMISWYTCISCWTYSTCSFLLQGCKSLSTGGQPTWLSCRITIGCYPTQWKVTATGHEWCNPPG